MYICICIYMYIFRVILIVKNIKITDIIYYTTLRYFIFKKKIQISFFFMRENEVIIVKIYRRRFVWFEK